MKNTLQISIYLMIIITGCSKSVNIEPEQDFDISELIMEEQTFFATITKLQEYYDPQQPKVYSTTSDEETTRLLSPLVDNGMEIHSKMLETIYQSEEFKSFSTNEQNQITAEIAHLSDQQLAELSFIINVGYYENSTSSIDWNRVRNCASFALGISGIRSLYLNTVTAGTVQTMIGALKLIGKDILVGLELP